MSCISHLTLFLPYRDDRIRKCFGILLGQTPSQRVRLLRQYRGAVVGVGLKTHLGRSQGFHIYAAAAAVELSWFPLNHTRLSRNTATTRKHIHISQYIIQFLHRDIVPASDIPHIDFSLCLHILHSPLLLPLLPLCRFVNWVSLLHLGITDRHILLSWPFQRNIVIGFGLEK